MFVEKLRKLVEQRPEHLRRHLFDAKLDQQRRPVVHG